MSSAAALKWLFLAAVYIGYAMAHDTEGETHRSPLTTAAKCCSCVRSRDGVQLKLAFLFVAQGGSFLHVNMACFL